LQDAIPGRGASQTALSKYGRLSKEGSTVPSAEEPVSSIGGRSRNPYLAIKRVSAGSNLCVDDDTLRKPHSPIAVLKGSIERNLNGVGAKLHVLHGYAVRPVGE